ncbi:MAG: cupin domain-containing protein [Actinomycetota bacterium]
MAGDEARLEETPEGAFAASTGWFVLNLAEARWMRSEEGGQWSDFEPENGFEHYGIGVHVLQPGQPNGKYHSENVQEDFLVLSGECILIVEDEERRLKAWDFFHCAPGAHHILVGAGDGPCAILMAGLRGGGKKLHYPVSEVAARHGASAPEETDTPSVAYRDWSREYAPVRPTWPL